MAVHIVLVDPEIHWNTGNIGRTCVATKTTLHLAGTPGFSLAAAEIRRSGLDYWPKLKLVRHKSLDDFLSSLPSSASLLFFSARAKASFWDAPYEPESYLIFGRESSGLPKAVLEAFEDRLYQIPIGPDARSLNLSTAAAVALYEGLRRHSSA